MRTSALWTWDCTQPWQMLSYFRDLGFLTKKTQSICINVKKHLSALLEMGGCRYIFGRPPYIGRAWHNRKDWAFVEFVCNFYSDLIPRTPLDVGAFRQVAWVEKVTYVTLFNCVKLRQLDWVQPNWVNNTVERVEIACLQCLQWSGVAFRWAW